MAAEKRRGCGYRQVGALYLVGGLGFRACDRLPLPLEICPACGGGIKQSRGFTWINPKALFDGDHLLKRKISLDRVLELAPPPSVVPMGFPCGEKDVLCLDLPERAGLMWVGNQWYSPNSFTVEAEQMGISKRINAIPRDFVVGETWVLLAHPRAATKEFDTHEWGKDKFCKFCGLAESRARLFAEPTPKCQRATPGIFTAFRPLRIETLVDDDTPQKEIEKLEKRGLTVIKVPRNDPDHHGKARDDDELEEDETQRVLV
jgi:hypothetical protein